MYTKRYLSLILLLAVVIGAAAQERKVQNKPYIDLRPLHFGILVGTHLQDIELQNVGPQLVTDEDGNAMEQTILTEADRWNPGISVGVLADLRLTNHLSLRFTPTMHFGAKHLTFTNLSDRDEQDRPRRSTQDLKNTYISLPIDLKFAAPRWNNYRPYLMGGINPMINLTQNDQDNIQLKRSDVMVEVGLGCDFYLPFFKLIPELKFCYSLGDALDHSHADQLRDINRRAFANSVSRAQTKMIVLTFYFE
ncbi:MAG: PorT family protein [Prevotella sp.]|nr:PorT family protein [Prevotella sp.]